jgi:hypothetical protein
MAIAPVRWIIPKSGGFSFSSVPRPGAPFSRRRRPSRPFFHGFGVALVPGHHVHLVVLDLAGEPDLGLALHDPLPELRGHPLGVIGMEVQLLRDLLVGEVQAHEVEAEGPDLQRWMMAGEDRPGQVVEATGAIAALVALAGRLGIIASLLEFALQGPDGLHLRQSAHGRPLVRQHLRPGGPEELPHRQPSRPRAEAALPPFYEHVAKLFDLNPILLLPFPKTLVKPTIPCEHALDTYLHLLSVASGGPVLPLDQDCVRHMDVHTGIIRAFYI